MEVWTTIILPILSVLLACAPLVIKLVDAIQKVHKEKNWKAVVQLVLKLMAEAEQNYANGAERKDYVMSSIKAMEHSLNYDIDEKAISELIDAVVTATKKINTK
jgi:sorbitol-specific phosphotransferase system component IIC